MRERLLVDIEDVRKLVEQTLSARRAGIDGPEWGLETILNELDGASAALRSGTLPPSGERMNETARIISDWFPRTELGNRIADLWNEYQHAR